MASVLPNETRRPKSYLPAGIDDLPKLDALQLGHLRHICNLAHNLDGDWSHMGGLESGQEYTTSYRYQLAWMAYALGIAHFHQLPGAPGVFKQSYVNLMRKMLRYDVWGYWEHTSKSSSFLDPGIEKLRDGWRDPVIKENIMYSGHVHAMAGMFGVLFDDDRYEKQGGLTFKFDPFFASGAETFEYDYSSLNEIIYWQMVESGFLGIACEPNMVFLVCNQFPMLGFRFHDVRKGTEYADEVTQAYEAAWRRKGWMTDGDFFSFYFIRQDMIVGAQNSYSAAVMNAWNSRFIHELYPRQIEGFFQVQSDDMLLPAPRSMTGEKPEKFEKPDSAVGLAALWLAEMGDQERLEKLLKYADVYLNPSWDKGGLYYPRNDDLYDDDGHFVHMDPWVGNALIAFARLNVADGLHQLYRHPWDESHFGQPHLADISRSFDVSRAGFLSTDNALVLTVRPDANAKGKEVKFELANFQRGSGKWRLEQDGVLLCSGAGQSVEAGAAHASITGEHLHVECPLAGESDFILWVNQ